MLLNHKWRGVGNSKPITVVNLGSHAEEVEDTDTSIIGAVMPSTVLGAGSESEEEVSAPLTVAHLQWPCCLMGPLIDEPITVKRMLNCGAHIMLIDDALVLHLGLCHFCLHKPLPISVALNNTTCSDSHLYEYMKIALFAAGSSYVLCMIKAIITPKLCIPLLLGLPFLSKNHIVADFFTCTAIDQHCGYDLLNPPVCVVTKKFIEPVVSRFNIKNNK